MTRLTKFGAILTAGFLLASAQTALAETQAIYSDASDKVFEVTVPDFWTLRVGGDRDIEASTEEGLRAVERVFGLSPENGHGVWMGLISPSRLRTLEDAKDYARNLGGQLAKTTEITGSSERRVAGYPAHIIEGTGRRNGKAIDFTVMLLDLPNNRVVVGLTVLEKGYDVSALDDVNAILQSIKAR
ncbi:hypothetical protein J7382_06415 [Shimia sp. R11_0]|uniref:hypothetical protein n=1 Tax=Shimia sp. R11_0 TaxID=2821096 RepID=UPI001ADA7F19|nr:hypothetical protein [Shimia sp. R11_0]MBO9477160.1 hypothetical protein [Shimia sp. R11_0]